MSNESNVKFTTFGPNRGLSLTIGNFQFVDGVCEVAANQATGAASILCRYHDVCYAHELEQKVAEYDTARENRLAATGEFPPATKLDEFAKSEQAEPQAPTKNEQQANSDEPQLFDSPTEETTPQEQTPQEQIPQDKAQATEGISAPEVQAEAKKAQGNGKKNSGKQNQQ